MIIDLDTILDNALLEPCPFCGNPAHLGTCAEMLTYVEQVKAGIAERTTLADYRARDARIAIGLPIKQDNNEFEWPGYLDGQLIAFYPNVHAANLALWNLLDTGACAAPDTEFAPVGWAA